jgi:hypothetical protein
MSGPDLSNPSQNRRQKGSLVMGKFVDECVATLESAITRAQSGENIFTIAKEIMGEPETAEGEELVHRYAESLEELVRRRS